MRTRAATGGKHCESYGAIRERAARQRVGQRFLCQLTKAYASSGAEQTSNKIAATTSLDSR